MCNKRTISLFLLVSLFVLFFAGCRTTSNLPSLSEQDSPRTQDVKTLYSTLVKVHPDFFANTSRKAFEEACLHALQEADTLSDVDFYYTLGNLAAMAKDSHTAVGITQEIVNQMRALPVQFAAIDGSWRLSVVESTYERLLGSTLLSINSVPIDEIIERAKDLYSHDNDVWLNAKIAQQLHLSSLYAYLGIASDPSDDVLLTVLPLDSLVEETVVLKPISASDFATLSFAYIDVSKMKTGPVSRPYRAFELNEGEVLFVQYNACISDEQFPIDSFIDQVLGLVSEKSYTKILIDLRYNSGGDSRLFEPMVKGLSSLQKEKGFSLDVLIGEGTFSSALMNAVHFTMLTDCRLVGTPTGGSVNHYGEVELFTLPNSGIQVMHSTKHFVMDRSYPAGSLQPDLMIYQTIEDLLNGIDTQVEAII
ncbi:MAG: hypothetical protein WCR13_07595 [Sphaerochaeta sp.]